MHPLILLTYDHLAATGERINGSVTIIDQPHRLLHSSAPLPAANLRRPCFQVGRAVGSSTPLHWE